VPVGALEDGDRIAYVLYQFGMDERTEWTGEMAKSVAALPADEREFVRDISFKGHPMVAMCRRQPGGTWALVADHHFLGGASVMISGVRTERQELDADVGGGAEDMSP
jgi:hypothetical protein